MNINYFEMVAGWQATPTALGDGPVFLASQRERATLCAASIHLINPSPHSA